MTGDDVVDARRLRRSALVDGIGDGLAAVALPLLAAGVTRDPLAVALVVVAQHLPWPLLLLALPTLGHVDRRTFAGVAGSLRAVTVGAVGLLAAVGQETIRTVQVAALLLGVAQALADEAARTAAEAMPDEAGTSAHARLSWAGMLGMGIVGLPLGGALYEVLSAVPLLLDVGVFATAALLALAARRPLAADERSPGRPLRAPAPGTAGATGASALAELSAGAVAGVLVLLALDDLGLGAPAFGLLLAGLAAASTVGALVAPTLGQVVGVRAGAALALVAVAVALVGAHATLDPDLPYPAVLALGVAAAGGMAATVLLRAGRRRAAGAADLTARPTFLLMVWAATPVGALVGGLAARDVEPSGVLVLAAGGALAAAAVAAVGLRSAPVVTAST